MMPGGRLFSQNPLVDLHWRSFEEEFVVFDQLSGITYRFDVLKAFVLDVLAQGLHSEASLVLQVVEHLGLVDAAAIPPLVHNILEELHGAGLVEVAEA